MAQALYMAVASYEPRGCSVSEALGEMRDAFRGVPGSQRSYLVLSGPGLIAAWLASWEPEQLAEARARAAEKRCLSEAAWWLGVYWESPYAKGASPEEVYRAVSEAEPLRYLIAYPMKKSPEWYLIPFEERRRIMGEHILIAREAMKSLGVEVRSYTTYAFGLAAHEFLVIYEAEDLAGWARVVEKLREAKARKWVVMEEPVIVGVLNRQ